MNRAVARLYELSNELAKFHPETDGDKAVLSEGLLYFTQLLGPMMPHLAEELWQVLGQNGLLVDAPWPQADPAMLVEETITMPVQVNGRLRTTLSIEAKADQETVQSMALEDPTVQRAIGDKAIRKIIVVPKRIVNIVV